MVRSGYNRLCSAMYVEYHTDASAMRNSDAAVKKEQIRPGLFGRHSSHAVGSCSRIASNAVELAFATRPRCRVLSDSISCRASSWLRCCESSSDATCSSRVCLALSAISSVSTPSWTSDAIASTWLGRRESHWRISASLEFDEACSVVAAAATPVATAVSMRQSAGRHCTCARDPRIA